MNTFLIKCRSALGDGGTSIRSSTAVEADRSIISRSGFDTRATVRCRDGEREQSHGQMSAALRRIICSLQSAVHPTAGQHERGNEDSEVGKAGGHTFSDRELCVLDAG
jgi:hypothetical protein